MARKLPKVMERDQVTALMGQPNVSCPTGLRNRAMLETMHRAGLRVSEVCSLAPKDIRWQSGELFVRNGKGGSDRVVPADADLLTWLKLWAERRPKTGNGHFFCTLKGGKVSRRYVYDMTKRLAKKAGLDPATVSPHVLRHCLATEMLEEGFTVPEVQQMLGHVRASTTLLYTHVRPTALGDKIRARGTEEEGTDEGTDEVGELAERLAALDPEQMAALTALAKKVAGG